MKLFKLEIYRGSELIYSNVYNDSLETICTRIEEYAKYTPFKLFVIVRQMYFNSFGELKPKMYKGNLNYSVSCTMDKTTTRKDIVDLFWRRERNLIDNRDFTN